MSHPCAPVSEVRERHNRVMSHPEHLAQYAQWISHLLQRLAENHEIKSPVRVIRKALVDVALIRGHSACDSALNLGRVDLHPLRAYAFVFPQPREQFAVPATQVQDRLSWRDYLADHRVIRAAGNARTDRWRSGSGGLTCRMGATRFVTRDAAQKARDHFTLLARFEQESVVSVG